MKGRPAGGAQGRQGRDEQSYWCKQAVNKTSAEDEEEEDVSFRTRYT